ncbi:hypothetical protein MAHJHV61_03690 [Mycobacterium avium subsp. hominissuis]
MIVTTEKNPKPDTAAETEPADDAAGDDVENAIAEQAGEQTDEAETDEAEGDEAEDEAPDEAEDGGELLTGKRRGRERRKRPWRRYLRRSVLPLLLVASLAVSGFLGWRQWQEHQVKAAGEQAQQAAIAYAQCSPASIPTRSTRTSSRCSTVRPGSSRTCTPSPVSSFGNC